MGGTTCRGTRWVALLVGGSGWVDGWVALVVEGCR